MTTQPTSDTSSPSEPPLWSIGIAMIVILMTPLVLYSFSPEGPIREGDTVFAAGEQHVRIYQANAVGKEKDEICLLDPNGPLIVLQAQSSHEDGSFLAQVQGAPTIEWPFCPVHAEVLLTPHQVFQKPPMFRAVQDLLTRLFNR